MATKKWYKIYLISAENPKPMEIARVQSKGLAWVSYTEFSKIYKVEDGFEVILK